MEGGDFLGLRKRALTVSLCLKRQGLPLDLRNKLAAWVHWHWICCLLLFESEVGVAMSCYRTRIAAFACKFLHLLPPLSWNKANRLELILEMELEHVHGISLGWE